MDTKQYKAFKVLGSLGLAGLLLLSMGLSLSLAQGPFTQTRITIGGGFAPSLSADGTIVAFQSDSDFLGQGIPNGQSEIWLYDTTTMTFTRITTSSGVADPSLSADGTIVAFWSDSDFLSQGLLQGQYRVWLYNPATMTVTQVTTAPIGADRDSFDPSLSADGTKMAFYSDADFLGQGIVHGQYEIWLYDTTSMTMTLTRVTTSSDGANRISYIPSLSADGTKVAFQGNSDFLGQGIPNGQIEIWLYDTSTMTVTRVTTSSDGPNRASFSASLNADGTKVAFWSDSDFLGQGIADNQYEIWLYDTASMTVTRVTTSSDGPNRYSAMPSLNADGTKVAFYSDSDFLGQGIPAKQSEIWLYDTTAMTLTRVTTSSDGPNRFSRDPNLSADGTTVAFWSDSDFLGQGIPKSQYEIWLFEDQSVIVDPLNTIYLPIILKN